MTELKAIVSGGDRILRCRWCRRIIERRPGRGRPKVFCAQKCRQWDWVTRQRSAELDLSENELVIARDQLDALHDDLYVLSCAVSDARKDLEAPGSRSARELTELVTWLIDAAEPLSSRQIL